MGQNGHSSSRPRLLGKAHLDLGGTMSLTCGVFYIHSTPSALCPLIEWAASGALGIPVRLDWIPQPAERSSYRAEYSWQGPIGTPEKVASVLSRWAVSYTHLRAH